MIEKIYYIDNAMENDFIAAMQTLEGIIPCFIEMIDIETVYIECRAEDLQAVEVAFAPFV